MTVSGLLGILIGLGLLIAFAFRGWSVLLLAPLAALTAAMFSREPLLAHWTQTFMVSAAGLSGTVLSIVSAWCALRRADGG
jgi:H+/gluconate symporter-like permease